MLSYYVWPKKRLLIFLDLKHKKFINMGKLNSLSKILNFINENNLQGMKPWEERFQKHGKARRYSNGYNTKLIANIRTILRFLGGNNIVTMLKGIL